MANPVDALYRSGGSDLHPPFPNAHYSSFLFTSLYSISAHIKLYSLPNTLLRSTRSQVIKEIH